jgi:hypothetical protein
LKTSHHAFSIRRSLLGWSALKIDSIGSLVCGCAERVGQIAEQAITEAQTGLTTLFWPEAGAPRVSHRRSEPEVVVECRPQTCGGCGEPLAQTGDGENTAVV